MKRKIVDGEQSARCRECGIAGIYRFQIARHQTGHPVIQMNDVEAFVESFCKLENCSTEETKPLDVKIGRASCRERV